jgi:hypothetical protein
MDAPVLADLEARVVEINAALDAFRVRADAGEDLTDEETDEIEANAAELEKLNKKIKALKLLQPTGQGRRTAPEPRATSPPAAAVAAPCRPSRGRTPSAWASARSASSRSRAQPLPRQRDRRCHPPAQRRHHLRQRRRRRRRRLPDPALVLDRDLAEGPGRGNLLNRCTPLVTDGNSMMIPKDETTPWQTTGGVQVYWEGEAQAPRVQAVFEMGRCGCPS